MPDLPAMLAQPKREQSLAEKIMGLLAPDVGGAMPEAYGADSPISDPIAKMIMGLGKSAVNGFMAPGRALHGDLPPEDQLPAALDMAGMMTLGAGAIPAEANSLRMAITAYHGSPHDFDRFDLSKIGTGEGAQSYGHGLYFAENEGVAKEYRDQLAGQVANPARNQRLSELAREMSKYEIPGQYRKYSDPRGYELAKQYDEIVNERAADNGRMYKVKITADKEHFLDWDKPLRLQPGVASKIEDLKPGLMEQIQSKGLMAKSPESLSGEGMYRSYIDHIDNSRDALKSKFGDEALFAKGTELARRELVERGIPGIKYLDQGSRAAGDGSRNFVVFDDKLIDIMKKYGIALAPAILGLGQQDQQN
jgi:hypothetical protein